MPVSLTDEAAVKAVGPGRQESVTVSGSDEATGEHARSAAALETGKGTRSRIKAIVRRVRTH